MKRILKYIITAILLITVNLSYAQETVNPILTGKATAINFGIGDTIGLVTSFSDQTGFGFTLDSLKENAIIIDQSGTIWKVNTITSQNALQAAIRIQKVYGTGLFPSGEIAISNVTTNYKFPSPATTNSTGITPKQQAEMLNYIIQKIDQQITEGESGISAGETIFYVIDNDSTYTINVLDTIEFNFDSGIDPTETDPIYAADSAQIKSDILNNTTVAEVSAIVSDTADVLRGELTYNFRTLSDLQNTSLILEVGDRVKIDETGTEYLVQADSVAGYVIDEIAVVTNGSNYAVLQAQNGEYNVDWFGAVGDGVTDDTDEIEKADDFAVIMNKNLAFSRTTYLISQATLSAKHIYGNNATFIPVDDSYIRFFNLFNVETVQDLNIDFSAITTIQSQNRELFVLNNSADNLVIIDNIKVTGHSFDAPLTNQSGAPAINSIVVSAKKGKAIIKNCVTVNSGYASYNIPIIYEGSTDFINNTSINPKERYITTNAEIKYAINSPIAGLDTLEVDFIPIRNTELLVNPENMSGSGNIHDVYNIKDVEKLANGNYKITLDRGLDATVSVDDYISAVSGTLNIDNFNVVRDTAISDNTLAGGGVIDPINIIVSSVNLSNSNIQGWGYNGIGIKFDYCKIINISNTSIINLDGRRFFGDASFYNPLALNIADDNEYFDSEVNIVNSYLKGRINSALMLSKISNSTIDFMGPNTVSVTFAYNITRDNSQHYFNNVTFKDINKYAINNSVSSNDKIKIDGLTVINNDSLNTAADATSAVISNAPTEVGQHRINNLVKPSYMRLYSASANNIGIKTNFGDEVYDRKSSPFLTGSTRQATGAYRIFRGDVLPSDNTGYRDNDILINDAYENESDIWRWVFSDGEWIHQYVTDGVYKNLTTTLNAGDTLHSISAKSFDISAGAEGVRGFLNFYNSSGLAWNGNIFNEDVDFKISLANDRTLEDVVNFSAANPTTFYGDVDFQGDITGITNPYGGTNTVQAGLDSTKANTDRIETDIAANAGLTLQDITDNGNSTTNDIIIGASGTPSYTLDVNGTVGFPSLSDGSLHTELVTRDSVTGELGYRDISDISLLSSDGTTLTTTDGSHRLTLDSPVSDISILNLSNNDDNYISMRATTNSSTEIRTLTDFIIKTNGNNERMRFKSDGGIVLQTETDNTSNTLYVKSSNGEISERSMVNIPLSSFDDTGYLTSEVDGSTTNEIQTFEETLIQGSNITGNRTVSINTGYLYFNSGSAASQVSQSSVLNTSLNGSLDFADIETNSAEIILRHRLQGDGSDQDYMYLKAAGLDLAHRNNISLNSDSLIINAPTLTLDQNTTLQSGGFSLTNEMTGSSFYRINTSDAVVNIQPNFIDQTVDGLSGDTRILQGFGGIDISRNTTGDTGYPDFIFMDNDTLSLNHTEQINIDAPIIEINGEKMRTGGPQQVAISGTSGSINLGSLRSQVVQIDMTSASTASPISITITNPISNGTYTFHWQNTDSGGHDLDLPANMLNAAGTAFDGSTTITYDADDWFTCYYDGTNFYCK